MNRSVTVCVDAYVDDSGAVGAHQAGGVLAEQLMFHSHHVLLGDALGDAHSQRDLGVDGLDDGCCRKRGRDINHSGICPCALLRLQGGQKGATEVGTQCHLMSLAKADVLFNGKAKSSAYLFDGVENRKAEVRLPTLTG